MLDERLVIVGAALSLLGSGRYAWSTLQGRTRPNRVTWFMWGAAPIIGFFAQLDAGVGLPSVMTLSVGLGPLLVFASSFASSRAYWRLSRFDLGCGAVSVIAIVSWQVSQDPTLGVVFAVLADLVAGVPTFIKAWRAPETENGAVFVCTAANGIITLLVIDTWRPTTYAFPAYIAVLGVSMWAVIDLRPRSPERR